MMGELRVTSTEYAHAESVVCFQFNLFCMQGVVALLLF